MQKQNGQEKESRCVPIYYFVIFNFPMKFCFGRHAASNKRPLPTKLDEYYRIEYYRIE